MSKREEGDGYGLGKVIVGYGVTVPHGEDIDESTIGCLGYDLSSTNWYHDTRPGGKLYTYEEDTFGFALQTHIFLKRTYNDVTSTGKWGAETPAITLTDEECADLKFMAEYLKLEITPEDLSWIMML